MHKPPSAGDTLITHYTTCVQQATRCPRRFRQAGTARQQQHSVGSPRRSVLAFCCCYCCASTGCFGPDQGGVGVPGAACWCRHLPLLAHTGPLMSIEATCHLCPSTPPRVVTGYLTPWAGVQCAEMPNGSLWDGLQHFGLVV